MVRNAMAEYIDREALEKALTAAAVNDKDKNRRTWAKAICILHDLPADDAALVVHGRWKASGGLLECQNCGEIYSTLGGNEGKAWDYCPDCGARMDGDDDG